jgi:tRNA-splicing ligase RtcB
LKQFLKEFHVVTPIDPNRADIRSRRDILRKWQEQLMAEAPYAYKPVVPVIETQVAAGTVRTVAELRPILTVKG